MSATHACPSLYLCVFIVMCYTNDEMSERTNEAGIPSVGNTQAMQEQWRHRQQHYTASLTRTPTCPNPAQLIQACHTAAQNAATKVTLGKYSNDNVDEERQQWTRYTSSNLLSLTCMHSILPAQKE